MANVCNVQCLTSITASIIANSYLEVYLPIGQAVRMYFVQKVDIFNKQVENWDDYFLSIAVGSLRSLCCSLQGCAVITKVAGWIHVMLFLWRGGKRQSSNTCFLNIKSFDLTIREFILYEFVKLLFKLSR